MIYWIGYIIFLVLSKIYFPIRVYGHEHLPVNQAFILASNHISNLDPFIVGVSSQRRLTYMAKEELFKKKIMSYVLKRLEAFPINRDISDLRALREVFRRLKGGLPVVMFPQGTRQDSSRETKIQSGVGFIAVKSGLPVIPVYIDGSDKVLPHGKKWFGQRTQVTVTFGAPMRFVKDKKKNYSKISHQIMERISTLA